MNVGRYRVHHLMQEQDWRAIQRQRPTIPQFRAEDDQFQAWFNRLPGPID